MTSVNGADGHPDVDEISALAEGLLSPSGAASVRDHLEDCPECADTLAALEEIRELLGAAPAPSPMPLDVAERIDAALAAEALLASTQPEADSADTTPVLGGPTPSSADGLPSASGSALSHRPARRRTVGAHVSRETSPGGAAGAGAGARGKRPPGSGPGRERRHAGGRRRTIVLGAVFTAVVIGMGSAVLQTMTGSPSDRPSRSSSKNPSSSGQVFSEGRLRGQVDTLLKDHREPTAGETLTGSSTPKPSLEVGPPDTPHGADGGPGSRTKTATPLQNSGADPAIPECVKDGIGRSDPPIAAERGVYEGKEAYLVVLPHTTDTTMVSAYVVDAACTRNSSAPAGTVLLTHSYPRS